MASTGPISSPRTTSPAVIEPGCYCPAVIDPAGYRTGRLPTRGTRRAKPRHEDLRALGQAVTEVARALGGHRRRKLVTGRRIPFEIVGTQGKRDAGRLGEHPLQGLRLHLDPLERRLLRGRSTIRCVPIAVVWPEPAASARQAPMRHLVEGALDVVFAVPDDVGGPDGVARWGVDGFVGTTPKDRAVRHPKTRIERVFDLPRGSAHETRRSAVSARCEGHRSRFCRPVVHPGTE